MYWVCIFSKINLSNIVLKLIKHTYFSLHHALIVILQQIQTNVSCSYVYITMLMTVLLALVLKGYFSIDILKISNEIKGVARGGGGGGGG